MSHHLPQWAQEMSPGYRGPTVAGTFGLLAVVTVLLLALLGWPTADASGSGTRPTTPPPCAEQWPPTCMGRARFARMPSSIQPGAVAQLGDRSWRRAVVVVGRRPVVTQRDLAVLTFASQQYRVPMAVAAELLARHAAAARPLGASAAATVARRTAARLEAGGYAQRLTVAGDVWLVPTGRGLALVRDDEQRAYELWRPAAWKLDHVAAVGRLRLALADRYPQARWESERAIRRRWARVHRAAGVDTHTRYTDGGLHFPDGQAVGVECELHVKKPHEYEGIAADQDPAWTGGVWWFTPPAQVDLLGRRLAEVRATRHRVFQLPEELVK